MVANVGPFYSAVSQLHFTDWPDHGVPDSTDQFLKFLLRAMSLQRLAKQAAGTTDVSRMVVHCSAGVGRSGVFCAVYAMLTAVPYGEKAGKVNLAIDDVIRAMRQTRKFMVQTPSQYKFTHEAVLAGTKASESQMITCLPQFCQIGAKIWI